MIVFRPLTSSDEIYFEDGNRLLNRTQGDGLFEPNYLRHRVQDSESYVVAAIEDKEILGIGVAEIIKKFEYYLPFDPNIVQELSQRKVGSFSTLAVLESLQGQGIGQKISSMRIDWLRSQHCEVILGVSWVSGLPHQSGRVFKKMGFREMATVTNFYYEDSIHKPFSCPGCTSAPCKCSAILYRLDL